MRQTQPNNLVDSSGSTLKWSFCNFICARHNRSV